MEKGKIYKNKIDFFKLIWLFTIGSMVGVLVEGIWAIYRHGSWETHSATLFGPFCIIYGIGAIVLYLISYFLENKSIYVKFIVFFLSGALIEYIGSLFQEIIFGSRSWNYTSHPLNIDGRVSFRMALIWGILGIIFIYLIYPLINKYLINPKTTISNILTISLAIFMLINLSVTSLAVMRWKDRINDVPASNKVDEYLDSNFDNKRMKEVFSNMKFIK